MNIYDLTVPQLIKMLKNVDSWLGAAIAHGDRKKFDINNLLKLGSRPISSRSTARSRPLCDNAKFIAGRLAGKEWPAHADTETTFEQLRARIASVHRVPRDVQARGLRRAPRSARSRCRGWTASGCAATSTSSQFALANFYFHTVTAYDDPPPQRRRARQARLHRRRADAHLITRSTACCRMNA